LVRALVIQGKMPILPIMQQLRESMIASPPIDRDKYLPLLSELYESFRTYPWEPTIHDCEVERKGISPVGMGGFGECWQGVFLGRQKVAMKCSFSYVSDNDARRRAFREMKAWQGLQHRNVLPFIGLYIQEEKVYMLSPWMEQGDMTQFLEHNPEVDRMKLILQIAEGLRYLHTYKPIVVHGDLKGANVLVSESGEACLGDFGLSHRAIQGANAAEGNSHAWRAGGNPRWQAPELLRAKKSEESARTTASDIFAFGRVMIEAFTGNLPFANVDFDPAIVGLVLDGTLPDRPTEPEVISRGLDDRMWEIVKECCQQQPSRRPTVQGVINRLLAPPTQPEHRRFSIFR